MSFGSNQAREGSPYGGTFFLVFFYFLCWRRRERVRVVLISFLGVLLWRDACVVWKSPSA